MTPFESIQFLQKRMNASIIGQENIVARLIIGLLANGNLLVEVKPLNQIGYPINKAKFEAAVKFCKTKGWRFVIWNKALISNKIYLMEQIKKK